MTATTWAFVDLSAAFTSESDHRQGFVERIVVQVTLGAAATTDPTGTATLPKAWFKLCEGTASNKGERPFSGHSGSSEHAKYVPGHSTTDGAFVASDGFAYALREGTGRGVYLGIYSDTAFMVGYTQVTTRATT